MGKYTSESIEKLRDVVDMVEIVSGHTDLKRAGTQFSGRCPFHDERTPSFSVNPVDKVYYCFGCSAGGDIFKFVQLTEGLEFPAAVEWLAERYAVEMEMEKSDPQAEERRRHTERLFELIDRTTTFYERFLWDSPEAEPARKYLLSRGFSEATLHEFRIGYSPSAWDRVLLSARRGGFTEDELHATGLGQRSEKGGVYDRFRGRVMFPLADTRGRVRGFGARALTDGQQPKYLNTSDGPLYRKGRQLFGAHLARPAAAKAGQVLAVEGYADVLALHQAGFKNSVAIMGTAVTDDQLTELARLAPTVLLALDADRAGRQAMIRAARVAEKHSVELLVVELAAGTDPADVVGQDGGVQKFQEAIDGAVTVLEFEVHSVLLAADLSTARGRDEALAELQPVFQSAPTSAVRDEQMRLVASKLELSPATLAEALKAASQTHDGDQSASRFVAGAGQKHGSALERPERTFMAMCLSLPEPGRKYLQELNDDQLSTDLMRALRGWLIKNFDQPLDGVSNANDELRAAVTQVAMLADREPASEQTIQLGYLQLRKMALDRAIAAAPSERKFALSAERQDIQQEMGELSSRVEWAV